MILMASSGTSKKGKSPGRAAFWAHPILSGEKVSADEAARVLRMSPKTLRKAGREGYVKGEWQVRPRSKRCLVATVEEWRKGVEAYQKAQREGMVPEGWESTAQAARRLGTTVKVLYRMVQEGYVQDVRRVWRGSAQTVYAPPEAWDEGYQRFRAVHSARPRADAARRRERAREAGRLRGAHGITPDEVERRRRELAERREEFRAFVLAVMQGLPLPSRFVAREGEENTLVEVG